MFHILFIEIGQPLYWPPKGGKRGQEGQKPFFANNKCHFWIQHAKNVSDANFHPNWTNYTFDPDLGLFCPFWTEKAPKMETSFPGVANTYCT